MCTCTRVCYYWSVPRGPTCLLWAAGSPRVLPREPGTDQTPGGDGTANSQPASGRTPVPRTGGLRACCCQQDSVRGWLIGCPTTVTDSHWPVSGAPVVRSWTLLIEKDLFCPHWCTFDLVYFSPSSPSFVLEILGSPCPPPASKRLSGGGLQGNVSILCLRWAPRWALSSAEQACGRD